MIRYFFLILFSVNFLHAVPSPPPNLIIAPKKETKASKAGLEEKAGLYFYPGVIFVQNGKWVGADNLLNLPKDIAVQVNIVKSDNVVLHFDEKLLEERVMSVFSKANITRNTSFSEQNPPLPLFNLVIMVYKYQDTFAAGSIARLYENVQLKRVQVAADSAFQAITWEQTGLVVAKSSDFEKLLLHTVEAVAEKFVTRISGAQK